MGCIILLILYALYVSNAISFGWFAFLLLAALLFCGDDSNNRRTC